MKTFGSIAALSIVLCAACLAPPISTQGGLRDRLISAAQYVSDDGTDHWNWPCVKHEIDRSINHLWDKFDLSRNDIDFDGFVDELNGVVKQAAIGCGWSAESAEELAWEAADRKNSRSAAMLWYQSGD
jgi:hypothetical protein